MLPNSITNSFGVLLAGAGIATLLYGITCLQTYLYFFYYPRDRPSLKSFVALIWVLDTAHIITVCHGIFYYLISCFQKPDSLVDGVWSVYTSIGLNVVTSFIVQIYFTQRIYKLCASKYKWWLTIVICLTVLLHFCFGIDAVVDFFRLRRFDRLQETAAVPITFATMAILSDVMVAGALCWLLRGHRTGIKRTDSLIDKLIVYAVNRCVLTSAVAVAEVICFRVLPAPFWAIGLDFIIGKLYANSLLASINCRRRETDPPDVVLGVSHELFPSVDRTDSAVLDSFLVRSRGTGSSRTGTTIVPTSDK